MQQIWHAFPPSHIYHDTCSFCKAGKQWFYFTGKIDVLKACLFFFFAYFLIFFFLILLLLNWNETKFLNFILNVFIDFGKRNEKSSAQDWPTANNHFLVQEGWNESQPGWFPLAYPESSDFCGVGYFASLIFIKSLIKDLLNFSIKNLIKISSFLLHILF